MRIHTLIVLFSALSLAAPLYAQSDPSGTKAQEQVLRLKAGEVEFSELLAKVGEYLNRTYLFERAMVHGPRGQVLEDPSLVLPRSLTLTISTAEDVLSQLLYSLGYVVLTMDREKGVYDVVKEKASGARAFRSARAVTPQDALSLRHRYEFIRTVLSVKHVEPRQLVSQLRSMGSHQSSAIVAVSNHQLVITDLAPMVANAIEILQAIDVPQPKPPVRLRSAESVALKQSVEHMCLRLKAMEDDLRSLRKKVEQLRESETRIRAAYQEVVQVQEVKDRG